MKVSIYRQTLNFNQSFSGKVTARRVGRCKICWQQTQKLTGTGLPIPRELYRGQVQRNRLNRIKNNLSYLRDLASRLYDEFSIVSLGEDRTPSGLLLR